MSALFRAAGSTAGCGFLAVRPRTICQMEESLRTDAPVSASVIFSHQSDAAGDTAPVPYGYCSRNGAGCIFRHDRSYPAQGAALKNAASLGGSDRRGSCLFWQIREDSVWILPFTAVMTVWNVGYVILALHKNRTGRQLLLQCLMLLLPILLLFGGNMTISAINQVHYGVFLTNDRTEGNFAELMSLLYHLQGNTKAGSDIWISRETIARAEAVSPTLQQLQPLLDSYVEDWSTSNGEIPGDHFSWVLRDAVQDSGDSPDAVSAQTFYGNVLSELHAAVEQGVLTEKQDGALYFSSQSRGILPSEIPGILSDTLQNVWKIAGYADCALSSSAKSTGRLSDIRRMEAFTSCLAVYPTLSQFQAADYDSIADETLYDFNEVYSSGMVSLLNKMNAVYQVSGKPAFLLALLALFVLTVRVIHGLFHRDRTDLELWILSCGILLSAVLLRFGCGLFTGWFTDDMQKFINSFYSCGVYILLQLFKYLAIGTIYEGGITYGKFGGTDQRIAENR